MKFTAAVISMLAAASGAESLSFNAPTTGVSSYSRVGTVIPQTSTVFGTATTATPVATTSTPVATTSTTTVSGPPPCRRAFNPKTPGMLGISCPVYSPFTRTYFYGHPMTYEEYRQNVIDFQTKRIDNTVSYQQQYQAYVQDRLRYHSELEMVNQEWTLEHMQQQRTWELERLEYQNEMQRAHFDRMEQQIPGFEVPEEYVDLVEQRAQWQREQLEYTLGLQEQKLQNYYEMQRLQQDYQQNLFDHQQEIRATQIDQWAELSKSQVANPSPAFYGAGYAAPRYFGYGAPFSYNSFWGASTADDEVEEEPRTDA